MPELYQLRGVSGRGMAWPPKGHGQGAIRPPGQLSTIAKYGSHRGRLRPHLRLRLKLLLGHGADTGHCTMGN